MRKLFCGLRELEKINHGIRFFNNELSIFEVCYERL